MTSVRKFYPEVRLKKLLSEAGGMTAGEAMERADAKLEEIRDDCLSAVDTKLTELSTLVRSEQVGRGARMYRCANEIFAEAGTFGLVELSAAAHSLCSLLARAEEAKLPEASVQVHIDAMRALRNPDVAGNKVARAAVLSGLRGLAQRAAT